MYGAIYPCHKVIIICICQMVHAMVSTKSVFKTRYPRFLELEKYLYITHKNFHQFLKTTFATLKKILYNKHMSAHETIVQYIKVILGILTLSLATIWGIKVINLLTIIANA